VTTLYTAWNVFARINTGIVGSNRIWGMDVRVRLFVLFCVQVAALRRANLPSKKSYQLCKKIKKLNVVGYLHWWKFLLVCGLNIWRMAVPQIKRLVAGFPPRRPGFASMQHVGFVVDIAALGRFSPSTSVSSAIHHFTNFSIVIRHNRPLASNEEPHVDIKRLFSCQTSTWHFAFLSFSSFLKENLINVLKPNVIYIHLVVDLRPTSVLTDRS
jgi:hypothetical protein